ncbi:hypothetical protein ACVNS2_12180 [Paenibacillus caseinilyticus]|uniref:Uncharacterized protein n=1 Tax=Paenibacillus mucilaginosus K02 TaxID=997761 RepID=I0BG94_9BACL|nr:hypothetical protein [Paenibacillus mucilaginosus]AFH61391.1 hypothetical protein B2K_11775 [Paenibacillus mucilaginosus K02]
MDGSGYVVEIVDVKADGRKITVISSFKNTSGDKAEILFGETLLNLNVKDRDGKVLTKKSNTKSIGTDASLPKDGAISEVMTYEVSSPGTYTVWVSAKFQSEGKEVEVLSEEKSIEIK